CREFWNKRDLILEKTGTELDTKVQQQVRLDLLDLAILGSNLHVGLASAAKAQDARREALRVLAEGEKLFGQSRVLYHERQKHAQALGLADVAEEAKRRAAHLPPRTAWESYAMGRALLDESDWEGAAAELDRAVALDPAGLWPNFYKGVCAYRLKKYDEA